MDFGKWMQSITQFNEHFSETAEPSVAALFYSGSQGSAGAFPSDLSRSHTDEHPHMLTLTAKVDTDFTGAPGGDPRKDGKNT